MPTPDHVPSGFTPAQWSALLAWLDEYKAATKLREGIQRQRTSPTPSQTGGGKDSILIDILKERSHDLRLLDGQLRVLSTAALEEAMLIGAVILVSDEPGQWWLLPVSDYSRPAVPGEWWIEGTAPAFSVVCIDAARQVPEQLLLNTRTLGRLDLSTRAKLARMLKLYRYPLVGKKKGDETLLEHCGPPYRGVANDPRNGYLAQRDETLGVIDRRVMVLLDEMEQWRVGFGALAALPLAANSGERMCHLMVIGPDGRHLQPKEGMRAIFLAGHPLEHPESPERVFCEWHLHPILVEVYARIGGCTFSWLVRHTGESLGTGVVSEDGYFAKLLNGKLATIMALREKWEATVIVVKGK